jgi:hypothetical protein
MPALVEQQIADFRLPAAQLLRQVGFDTRVECVLAYQDFPA